MKPKASIANIRLRPAMPPGRAGDQAVRPGGGYAAASHCMVLPPPRPTRIDTAPMFATRVSRMSMARRTSSTGRAIRRHRYGQAQQLASPGAGGGGGAGDWTSLAHCFTACIATMLSVWSTHGSQRRVEQRVIGGGHP